MSEAVQRSRPWHALAVLGVAAAVRAWAFWDARSAPFWSVPLVDEEAYISLAHDLLSGRAPSFGAYYFAPGYAYLLAAVFALGGSVVTAKILNLVAGIASAGLVWRLTRRAFGVRAAFASGLAAALLPTALLQELLVLKSALATLAVLTGLVLLCERSLSDPTHFGDDTYWRQPVRGGRVRWILSGVAFGFAGLLRAELFAVAAALAAAGIWARIRRWPGAAQLVAPFGFAVAVLAAAAVPTVQNWQACGEFVPVAFGGGTNFFIGNHDGADGGYVPLRPDRSDPPQEEVDAVLLARRDRGGDLGPAGVSRYWYRRGFAWWRAEPRAALRLTLEKAMLTWGPHEIADVISTPLAARFVTPLALPLGAWIVLPLALVGLWSSRAHRALWPLRTFLLAAWLVLVPFFLFERFRLHLVAASLPFAAHAGVQGWEALRQRRFRRLGFGLAAAALLGLGLGRLQPPREDIVLRVNLGEMLFQSGRFAEALVEFEAVRQAVPEAWRVERNIANTLVAQGRFAEALPALDRLLERLHAEGERTRQPSAEELAYAHELAGDILFDLGRPAEAARHYGAALPFAAPPDRPLLERKRAQAENGP